MGKLVTVKPFYEVKREALAELTGVVVKMMWKLGMSFGPTSLLVLSQTEPNNVLVSENDFYKSKEESSKRLFNVCTVSGICMVGGNSFPNSFSSEDLEIFNKSLEILLKDTESGKSIEEFMGKEIEYWVLSPFSLNVYFKDKTQYHSVQGVSL